MTFEKNIKAKQICENNRHIKRWTLDDCYKNASKAKKDIYVKWLLWAYNHGNVRYFSVISYNSNWFTLSMLICTPKAKEFYYITPKHNYIWEE